ncbi:MAG: hypothetical protein UH625_02625 [Muribaculaceae bacterium]|nr:hypothetical protein [Muribaculaceae bacterium]
MKKRSLLISISLMLIGASASGEILQWDKIEHWSGDGPNKAALVVQFDTGANDNPGTIVWGFRWNDGESLTSEDMLRAIASDASDLLILVQFTGSMGSTLNGLGYASDVTALIDNISYDFDHAKDDSRISFGFITPNKAMGQTKAPGDETPSMIFDALEAAKTTHIIDHPLNQREYGYPAYDYDWWKLSSDARNQYWNSGWYESYWSFWLGDADLSAMTYSGMGMSSVELHDGDVHGWKHFPVSYEDMNNDFFDYIDSHSDWLPLNYKHFNLTDGVELIEQDGDNRIEYYNINGTKVEAPLSPGLYIRREGNAVSKLIVR